MTRSMTYPLLTLLLAGALGCDDRRAASEAEVAPPGARPGPLPASSAAGLAAPAISVAQLDRATRRASAGLPVEARLLLLSASGSEPKLAAMRAALDFRGTPYDVFVAATDPPLTADCLASGNRGLETMLQEARDRSAHGFGLPGHVERSFRRYLDCGVLARG